MYLLIAFLSLAPFLVQTLNSLSPIVPPPLAKTSKGLVEGTTDGWSRGGRQFYQFRGIQYAVIKERFEPAAETVPWTGVKDAKEFGLSCDAVEVHGDENCLFLNVFTPKLPQEWDSSSPKLLPVVVHIHGGSFYHNSAAMFGPNYLLDEDVVFVTINYRLGVLGFLSTGDEHASGNYGLKDQVSALKWIQENIYTFSGDKNNVTIMGQSAGSASVTYHLVSPLSRGLFSKAIACSGTFLDPWSFTRNPIRYARKFAQLQGLENATSSEKIVRFLRKLDSKTVARIDLNKQARIKFFNDPLAGFAPVIEPEGVPGAFLTKSPYELLKAGDVAKVPVLTGLAKEEGVYLWAAPILFGPEESAISARNNLQNNWTLVAPHAFYFADVAPPERHTELGEELLKFYFDTPFSIENTTNTFPSLVKLYSDRLFVSSGIRFMNLLSKHNPVYPYLYTYDKFVGIEFESVFWERLKRTEKIGATHVSELDMFISPLRNITRVDEEFDKVSRAVVKLWTSFINTGVPSETYGEAKEFPKIDGNEGLQQFYQIDSETKLLDNIFKERVEFWVKLGLEDNNFEVCYCNE